VRETVYSWSDPYTKVETMATLASGAMEEVVLDARLVMLLTQAEYTP